MRSTVASVSGRNGRSATGANIERGYNLVEIQSAERFVEHAAYTLAVRPLALTRPDRESGTRDPWGMHEQIEALRKRIDEVPRGAGGRRVFTAAIRKDAIALTKKWLSGGRKLTPLADALDIHKS